MTLAPDEDGKNKNVAQEAKEKIKEPPPHKKIAIGLLSHFLNFLGGALLAGLWLKFISYRRYEVEWGMDCFRDPKILIALTAFFFLMGMCMVCGIRHIIAWIRECRTYEEL
jgi:hypothetical protein